VAGSANLPFFVIQLAIIFATFHTYHVRKPLAIHIVIHALADSVVRPAKVVIVPIARLISAVYMKFASLNSSGLVLLPYPARHVRKAMRKAMGAACPTA